MNEMLIKVSIIVVSLNTKIDFLETIQSIKRQTYKNYETIVIDGKSNDGTVECVVVESTSNNVLVGSEHIFDITRVHSLILEYINSISNND